MKKNETRKKGMALVKGDGNSVEKSYAAWIADLKRTYLNPDQGGGRRQFCAN